MALSYINNKEIKFGSSKPLNGVYTPGSPTREYEPLDSLGIYLNSGIPLSYGVENGRYMSMSDEFAATSQGNSYSFNQFFAAQMMLGFKLHDRFIACDTEHKIIGTEPLLHKAYLAEITEKTLDYFKIKIYGEKTRTFCIRMSSSEVPTSYVDLTNSFDENGLNLTQTDRQSFLSYYRFYPLTARDPSSRDEETLGVDYYLLPSTEGLGELSGDILSKFNAFISSDGSTLTSLGNTAFAYAGDIDYVPNYRGETSEAAVSAAEKAEVILSQVEEMRADINQLLPEMEENLELTKQYRDEAMSTEIGTVREDLNQLNNDLSQVSESLAEIAEATTVKTVKRKEIVPQNEWHSGFWWNGSANASESYSYSDLIAVKAGDIIRNVFRHNGDVKPMRFIEAYNGNSIVSAASSSTDKTEYIVPTGVNALRITVYSANISLQELRQVTETTSYAVRTNPRRFAYEAEATTLVANTDIVPVMKLDNKKNCSYVFYGEFNSFGALTIGHGKTDYMGVYLTIDPTNVTIYAHTGAVFRTIPHTLTLKDFISVNIQVQDTKLARANIRIGTNGGYKEIAVDAIFNGCNGMVYANANIPMFNVKFQYIVSDMRNDVFVFGDSYLSLADNNRWTTQILNHGYNKMLLCGFGGARSEDEIISFRNIVNVQNPKYIVWCLGMNDPDTSTVNASWKSCVDEVIDYCEKHKIVPILATIPNTPIQNNMLKNEYVRNSGHRYIDFAKAVNGETANASWYNGMLSSDNVHPTESGAIALMNRVLLDLPEINY